MEQNTSNIVRSTLAVAVISLLLKGLGFLEKVLQAYFFGTNPELDAYLVALGVVLALFLIIRELVEPGFLRVFMEALSAGDREGAWSLFNSIGLLIFLVVAAVVTIAMVFPELAINLFAPGFTGEKRNLAVALTRLTLPAALFLSLSALTYITLNGMKRFALPASGDLAFKGGIIVALVLLYKPIGIWCVVWGIVAGAFFRLLVHMSHLWRRVSFKNIRFGSPRVKAMQRLTVPLFFGVLFAQISGLVDIAVASYLADGSIAALSYAKKIVDVPILLFPYVLSIIIFPYFSQLAIEKKEPELSRLLSRSVQWIVFVFLPLSLLLLILATPIVQVLLQRGAFDAASTRMTSGPTSIYALGMVAFAVETIIVQFFFACADTKTPVIVGIICVLVNIVLTLLLMRILAHNGIALALVVSKSLKVLVLLKLVGGKVARARVVTRGPLLKCCLSAAVMGLVVFVLHVIAWESFSGDLAASLAYLAICFTAGGLIYLTVSWLLGLKGDLVH